MDVPLRLLDLPTFHPRLWWEPSVLATVAVFEVRSMDPPFQFPLQVEKVPGFGSEELHLLIDPVGVRSGLVARLRHTYEPARLVELAAIAVAGLGLYQAGGHEILDVALRGSAADYLVDVAHHRLEIAGRSRRRDLETAWEQRRQA